MQAKPFPSLFAQMAVFRQVEPQALQALVGTEGGHAQLSGGSGSDFEGPQETTLYQASVSHIALRLAVLS